jgi:hypothetical protein
MKKTAALAFLFCLISTIADAQIFESKKNITCGNTKFMLKGFAGEEINEHPIWVGTTEETKTRTVILVNKNTQTWSVIQLDDKVTCVLSTGEGYAYKAVEELK